MKSVPTFFGEPGLHLCTFLLLSPGSRLLRQQGRASSTNNPALRLRPRRTGVGLGCQVLTDRVRENKIEAHPVPIVLARCNAVRTLCV
jgi:hypothetical protein